MIKSIGLNNFKCFEETHLDFRLVNVFIGPNGSGKSSIAQALMILKQSVGKKYLNLEEPINLGKFEDILYFMADSPEITIKLSGIISHKYQWPESIEWLKFFVHFSYVIALDKENLKQQQISFQSHQSQGSDIELRNFQKLRKIEAKCSPTEEIISPEEIRFENFDSINLRCGKVVGQPIEIAGSTGDVQIYRDILTEIFDSVKNIIQKIFYVPGLRGINTPTSKIYDEQVAEFTQNKAISADAEKLVTALGEYPDIAKKTSRILESVINTNIQYKIAPGRKQTIDVLRHDWKTSIVNEGLGLNQMLFPLFQVLIAPEDSFIIIEEPELHLHPRAQAKFVNELVKIAKEEKKQLLLITHSEHILFRLLTLIAKKELPSGELNIYSFSLNSTGARAKKLEVTEDGRLKGALPGFFEHEIEELGEFLKAASESQ